MMKETEKKSLLLRVLNKIEVVGNKLPAPTIIFLVLAALVVALSAVGSLMGWNATGEILNTKTGELENTTITVFNLLSADGSVIC